MKIGYREYPFQREMLELTRLTNTDLHPDAPIIEISVRAEAGGKIRAIMLTRADVAQLVSWLRATV